MTIALGHKPRRHTALDPPDDPPAPPVTVTVDRGTASGVSVTKLGLHIINDTLEPGGDATAKAAAKVVYAAACQSMCHHAIRGFGATQLQTAALETYAQINWSTFDRVVDDAQAAGLEILTVLGMAPAFMTNDPSQIDKRVLEEHHAAFATVCGYVARRMAEFHGITGAKYCMWNELKGYWDPNLDRWKYEEVTTLYNLCVTAVLAEDATALMGGLYSAIRPNGNKTNSQASNIQGIWGALRKVDVNAVEYFVNNASQIDFLCYSGKPSTRDGVTPEGGYTLFERIRIWKDVNDWLRGLPGMSAKPVSLMEWYAAEPKPTETSVVQVYSRYSAGCYWHIVGSSYSTHTWKPEALGAENWGLNSYRTEAGSYVWTETSLVGGGQQEPWGVVMQRWRDAFPAGTTYYIGVTNDSQVLALSNATHTILVNGRGEATTVGINGGAAVNLAAYETKLVAE